MIDLHTHSTRSDGSLSPAELVGHAVAAGLDVMALTDHDTVAGLEEAAAQARGHRLRLVPGVEISATWRSQTLHVLGLWIDPASPSLRTALASQEQRRHDRMRRMCARLDRMQLPGERLLREVESRPGIPTRTHLAGAMVAAGLVTKAEHAFRKYLAAGKCAHVPSEWPPLEQVVGWILAAGGVAALAHPARYRLSSGARRRMLGDFAAAGGAALEVVTGRNGAQHAEGLAMMAAQFGLEASVGSDFHGPELAWNPLGRSLKLPNGVTPVWRGRET